MAVSIFFILVIFSVLIALLWMWFFKAEKDFCHSLYSEGMEALALGDYAAAKDAFLKLNIINPGYLDMKFQYGFVLYMLREYVAAKECFEQATKYDNQKYRALFYLGQLYQVQKNYERADEYYNLALKEDEKSLECYFNLGLIYYFQKNYTKALEFFENALEISPDDVGALFYKNRCSDELCEYDDDVDSANIIKGYLSLLGQADLPLEFNFSLARAYAKTGQVKEATKYCQDSLVLNPEDVESYKLMGLIQLVRNDLVGAKNSLAMALRLQSKNREAHEILSYVLCQQDNMSVRKMCREKYHGLIRKFLE